MLLSQQYTFQGPASDLRTPRERKRQHLSSVFENALRIGLDYILDPVLFQVTIFRDVQL